MSVVMPTIHLSMDDASLFDGDIERLIIDSAPTAMVMIDQRGRMVLVNSQAEALFGYSRAHLVGQPVEMLVPHRFRSDHPQQRDGFFNRPTTRRMGAGRDLFGLRADGSEVPVEIGLNPIRSRGQLYVVSAIVDISERKRMESALHQAKNELEHRVDELARSTEALERSNLDLRRFAFIASHDLQAPLRSIGMFVQLLQEHFANSSEAEVQDWLGRVLDGTQRMQAMVHDLLEFARVDSRSRPFAPVDLNQVVEDALHALEASVVDAQANIERTSLPTIPGDRSQLVQLFQNLIGNAITYHGDRAPCIRVYAEADQGGWIVNVTDTGIGIPEQFRNEVFDIFRRLHPQEAYPGSGIGLAICRRVVERHGGRIWVEGCEPNGSNFRIRFAAYSQISEGSPE
jgi:PAS domain S-box-containing protein